VSIKKQWLFEKIVVLYTENFSYPEKCSAAWQNPQWFYVVSMAL